VIQLGRIKDGAMVSTKEGTIYKLVNTKQFFDGDNGAVEVRRMARCERLRDKRIILLPMDKQVILLEGEKRY